MYNNITCRQYQKLSNIYLQVIYYRTQNLVYLKLLCIPLHQHGVVSESKGSAHDSAKARNTLEINCAFFGSNLM